MGYPLYCYFEYCYCCHGPCTVGRSSLEEGLYLVDTLALQVGCLDRWVVSRH